MKWHIFVGTLVLAIGTIAFMNAQVIYLPFLEHTMITIMATILLCIGSFFLAQEEPKK